MKDYIKPCPLCGGEVELIESETVFVTYFIRCKVCGLQTRWFNFKDKIIEYWNRRQLRNE